MDSRDVTGHLPVLGKRTLMSGSLTGGCAVTREDERAAGWTNRTVRTLSSLSSGRAVEHEAAVTGSNVEWSRAGNRERELVHEAFVNYKERMQDIGTLTARSAYERLARGSAVVPGPYAKGQAQKEKEQVAAGEKPPPSRGEVCGAQVDNIALPAPGSKPVRISTISAMLRTLFLSFRVLMLRAPEDVDWDAYRKLTPYADPALKIRENLLRLLARMYWAGMLIFVAVIEGEVAFFCVVKKVVEGGRVLRRLVWDLRKANLRWKKPGRAALGSPAAFTFLEMGEPCTGTRYGSYSGDVLDWYYTCEIEEEVAQFFGIGGVTAQELAQFMWEQHGEKITVPEGRRFIAIRVLGMGWSWACMIAQILLETVTESVPRLLRAFRVSDVLPTPLMACDGDTVHWGFIDDYAGILRGREPLEQVLEETRQLASEVRKTFVDLGWPIQKETLGCELLSLGIDFDLVRMRVRAVNSLFWLAFFAAEYMLCIPFVEIKVLERVVGIWTWLSLIQKPGLSCFFFVYRYINRWREAGGRRPLARHVRGELSSILGLGIYFTQTLTAPWFRYAYLTDSSPIGGAVIRCLASPESLRAEARFAEKNGWWSRLEEAGAAAVRSFEELNEDLSEELLQEELTLPERLEEQRWAVGHLPILDFFVVMVTTVARHRRDVGWRLKTEGALKSWRVRILWISPAISKCSDIVWEECWKDLQALCSAGKVALSLGLIGDDMIMAGENPYDCLTMH